MAIELATGYVSLVPSTKGFSSRLKSELKGVGTTAGAQVGGEFNDGMGSKVSGLLRGIGVAAAKTGAVIGVAGAALGTWGLKNAADMQQTQIAFEGIFGSASSANAFLGELKSFAARTPFEFPELANASKQLLAVGFSAEEVIPSMTKIGNVAATLGVGGEGINSVVRALGQMKGKGKASAEELQQISEAIPGFSAIGAIADSMGISTSQAFDLMAKGAIPADQAIQAILAGMDKFPGAAGAMERQSKTLAGVLSTLKDTVSQALVGGIGPALPALADSINQAMPSIGTAIGSFGSTFGQALVSVTPLLNTLLPIITKIADVLAGVFGTAVAALVPVFQKLAPHIGKIVEVLGGAFTKVIDALAPALPPIADAIGALAGAFGGAFAAVIKEIAPPLGEVAKILGGALAKAAKVLAPVIGEVGKVFAESLGTILKELKPVLPDLADAFAQMAIALAEILKAVLPLVPPIAKLAALLIREITAPVLVAMAKAFALMATAIADLVGWVANLVGHFGDLGGIFSTLGEAVASAAKAVGGFFSDLPGKILGWLGDVARLLWQKGVDLIVGLISGIWQKALDLARWYMSLPGLILGWIGDVLRSLWQKGSEFIAGLLQGIIDKAVEVVFWFGALPGAIVNWIGDVTRKLYKKGEDFIQGMWDGMKAKFAQVLDWVKNLGGLLDDSVSLPDGTVFRGVDGKKYKMKNGKAIPVTAMGGIFNGAQLRIIGEAGPEAVLPLNKPARARAILAQTPLAGALASGGVQFGDINILEASRPREVASEVLTLAGWKLTGRADG